MNRRERFLAGIFVGGESSRMGQPKGLLRDSEGRALVPRTAQLFESLEIPWMLVGVREEYAHLAYPALADDPPGIGPLGGLVALLKHAGERMAVAVACDMPRLSAALVGRLIDDEPSAPILAPRRDGRWEPFCARFDSSRVLPIAVGRAARGLVSMQGLFEEAGAVRFAVTTQEEAELEDWDAPRDVGA